MTSDGPIQVALPLRYASTDCILAPGDVFQAVIRNITLSGLQLTGPRLLEKGQRMTVCVSAREPEPPRPAVVVALYLECEVVWCRDLSGEISFGLKFLPMCTREMQDVVGFFHREYGLRLWEWPDKRDHPRVSRKLVCHYRDRSQQQQLAMLRDLSATGLGLVTMQELPIGTQSRFRFGVSDTLLFERAGKVVRCRKIDKGFDVGVIFDPMSEEEQAEVLRAVATAAQE